MKPILPILFLYVLPALGQPVISPEVHPNGTVTFRLPAPNAHEVRLHCETGTNSLGDKGIDMEKGTNGVWTTTTAPLAPDIYGYCFDVDGLQMIDPNNPFLKYNLRQSVSQVEVPGPDSTPWQIEDVPHGELHRHFYKSAVGGDQRDFMVYTPPGYNPSNHKRYPVLYLLHGYTDDTTAWTQTGRANVILDNLIARGQARPMIVVMPLGYGAPDILKLQGLPDHDPLWQTNLDRFTTALLDEVMPQVEKNYRVLKGAENTAIAGLSMGGSESLIVGLNHPNRFSWIGAFSTGGLRDYPDRFPALDGGINKNLRLVWLACGQQDFLFKDNRELCDWLSEKGLHYTWVEIPGIHSYRVWRPFLADFVPLLFLNNK